MQLWKEIYNKICRPKLSRTGFVQPAVRHYTDSYRGSFFTFFFNLLVSQSGNNMASDGETFCGRVSIKKITII